MIDNLRKKFILVSAVSILIVFFIIFAMMVYMGNTQLNHTMDALTDAIASEGGTSNPHFFIVWLDDTDQIVKTDADAAFQMSEIQIQEYTDAALEDGGERGWVSAYRYQVVRTKPKTAIIFANGTMNYMLKNRFLLTSLLILAGSGLVILALLIIISKKVVRPTAESYEKQKQFITDVNHDLKTPLTLILSNLEIVEAEIGKNEWLDDIRCEGRRMEALINQLVMLSRMDEDQSIFSVSEFDLSNAVSDTVSEFRVLAENRHESLTPNIGESIFYKGDEGLIRRLLSVLIDNAVKYCDIGGQILVVLYKKRYPVLIVENTFANAADIEIGRLFDRFYRADKARVFNGGFGIGLSIAEAIVKKHHGDISAYKKEKKIGFKVEFRQWKF